MFISISKFFIFNLLISYVDKWGLGWRSGQGTALLVGRSRYRFPVASLDFSVTYSFWPYHGPGVDSGPSENEHQEHFLEVKATGAWGWQPHHLNVPNVMEIWEPNPPGTLWATPGLLRDCFTAGYCTQLTLKLLLLWSHNTISDSHGSAMQSSVHAHRESRY